MTSLLSLPAVTVRRRWIGWLAGVRRAIIWRAAQWISTWRDLSRQYAMPLSYWTSRMVPNGTMMNYSSRRIAQVGIGFTSPCVRRATVGKWTSLRCKLKARRFTNASRLFLFRLHEGLADVGVSLEDLHERQEFVGRELFYQLASVGIEVDAWTHFSPHGVEPETVGGLHQFIVRF